MPGFQSSLHSGLQVCHEHGGGGLLPPQDNTPLRALARTRTDKSRGSVIRWERSVLNSVWRILRMNATAVIFVLAWITFGDIEMLMKLHSCCAGRFFVTLILGEDFTLIFVNDDGHSGMGVWAFSNVNLPSIRDLIVTIKLNLSHSLRACRRCSKVLTVKLNSTHLLYQLCKLLKTSP